MIWGALHISYGYVPERLFPKMVVEKAANKKKFNPTKFYDWSIHCRFGNGRFGNGLSGMISTTTTRSCSPARPSRPSSTAICLEPGSRVSILVSPCPSITDRTK